MLVNLIVCWILALSGTAPTNTAEQVELFDTDTGRVVQARANSAAFQTEARNLLGTITGRVLDVSPELQNATIVKIPVTPAYKLTSKPVKMEGVDIVRIFIIMPKSGARAPWMLLHDSKDNTVIVEFDGKLDTLRQLIKQQ